LPKQSYSISIPFALILGMACGPSMFLRCEWQAGVGTVQRQTEVEIRVHHGSRLGSS
jgi:hypothetical protein